MHHNNNVGLTIAIQFGGARPIDHSLGGGAIAPPAPPVPPPLGVYTLQSSNLTLDVYHECMPIVYKFETNLMVTVIISLYSAN